MKNSTYVMIFTLKSVKNLLLMASTRKNQNSNMKSTQQMRWKSLGISKERALINRKQ